MVKRLGRRILKAKEKVIEERVLVEACGSSKAFNKALPKVTEALRVLGFELVRTTLGGKRVYMLVYPGDVVEYSSELLGKFVCLSVFVHEGRSKFNAGELDQLFGDWSTMLRQMAEHQLISYSKDGNDVSLELGPVGKALLKDVRKQLTIHNLMKWIRKGRDEDT